MILIEFLFKILLSFPSLIMSAALRRNIRLWLNNNSSFIRQNAGSFKGLKKLTVKDSTQDVFDSWKTRAKTTRAKIARTGKDKEKDALWREAKDQYGWGEAKSYSSVKRLNDRIEIGKLWDAATKLGWSQGIKQTVRLDNPRQTLEDFIVEETRAREETDSYNIQFQFYREYPEGIARKHAHLIIRDGIRYQRLTDIMAPYVFHKVSTRIKEYEGQFVPINDSKEFDEFQSLFHDETEFHTFQTEFGSLFRQAALLFVSSLSRNITTEDRKIAPDYVATRKYRDDRSDRDHIPCIAHPNFSIPYRKEETKDWKDLFSKKLTHEYFVNNYRAFACLYSGCIERFKDVYDKKYKTTKLGYERLQELMGVSNDNDLSATLDEFIDKFCKRYHVTFRAYDIFNKVIKSYTADPRKSNLRKAIYVLAYNGHCYFLEEGLSSLAQRHEQHYTSPQEEIKEVSSSFYVNTSTDTKVVFCDNFFEDIRKQDFTCEEGDDSRRYQIVTNTELKTILREMRKINFMPIINLQNSTGEIGTLTVFINGFTVVIRNPEENRIFGKLKFESEVQCSAYYRLSQVLEQAVFNRSILSYYPKDWLDIAQTLAMKALVGRVGSEEKKPNYMIDISKSFPSCLNNRSKLIGIGEYDNWYAMDQYGNDWKPEDSNFYIYSVVNETLDEADIALKSTLLANTGNIAYGEDLKKHYADIKRFIRIIGFCTVSRHTSNLRVQQALAEVFNSKEISVVQKKFIGVKTTGMIERDRNTKKITRFFEDSDECYSFGKQFDCVAFQMKEPRRLVIPRSVNFEGWGGKPITMIGGCDEEEEGAEDPVLPERKLPDLWYTFLKNEKKLSNGFYPIKLAIYSDQAFRLYSICKRLQALGAVITHLHTDCVFFSYEGSADLFKEFPAWQPTKPDELYDSLGALKLERYPNDKSALPRNGLKNKRDSKVVDSICEKLVIYKDVELHELKHEAFWRENPNAYENEAFDIINNHITQKQNLIILADEAGGGKTTLVTRFLRKNGYRFSCVAFTGMRVEELKADLGDDTCFTLHEFLGLQVTGKAIESKKALVAERLAGLEVLFIDEVYLFNTSLLNQISKIKRKYPHITLLATGDVDQCKVSDIRVDNEKEYYQRAMAQIFKKGIILHENKRMASRADILKLKEIKRKLFHRASNEDDYLGLVMSKTIEELRNRHVQSGQFVGKILAYFVDSATTVNNIIHSEIVRCNESIEWKEVKDKKLAIGLRLIFRDSKNVNKVNTKRGKQPFIRSQIYTVKSIDDESETITLEGKRGEQHIIEYKNIDSFEYEYCRTIHSSQGCTYRDEPLSIVDVNSCRMDEKPENLYTAISRTNALSWVWLFEIPELRFNWIRFEQMVRDKIEGYKQQDHDRGMSICFVDEYIDYNWVKKRLFKSDLVCPQCNGDMSIFDGARSIKFTIQRIDNSLDHYKDNCFIMCCNCNNTLK